VRKKHGGNIYQIARHLGIPPESILDFSASINPLGFSPRFKKNVSSLDETILNYPDLEAHAFINALAAYHKLPRENFAAGNGSTEFIYLLPEIIRPKSVLIVAPTFTEYEHSYQRAKGLVFYCNTLEKDGFSLQTNNVLDALKRGYGMVYLCNPGSPSGALSSKQAMKEIITAAGKKGTQVILDETFMDFTEEHSLKHEVTAYDNLYILRSMTKFFALPGLRIGYVISHGKNIEKIQERQQPWSINAVAQHAGTVSLQDTAYIQKTIQYINEARQELAGELKRFSCLHVFSSFTNFLLIKLLDSSPKTTAELQDALLKKGILIRTCEDFQGLSDKFFRVAVKKKNENKRLAAELKKILSGTAS